MSGTEPKAPTPENDPIRNEVAHFMADIVITGPEEECGSKRFGDFIESDHGKEYGTGILDRTVMLVKDAGFDLDKAVDLTIGPSVKRDEDGEIIRQSYEDARLTDQPQEAKKK